MFGGEKERREEISKDSNILMVPAGSHPPPLSPTPRPLHSLIGAGNHNLSNNCHLHQFARAALSKYHKLGGLNNRNVLSHSFGSGSSDQGAGKVGSSWGLWARPVPCLSLDSAVLLARDGIPWLVEALPWSLLSSSLGTIPVCTCLCPNFPFS